MLATLLCLGCGGRPSSPAPQSINDTLAQFMAAVKANDLQRMGQLWGSQRGPAASYMDAGRLKKLLGTIQVYWAHRGYRVIDGPLPAQPLNPTFQDVPEQDRLRDFRVELQRASGCNQVIPITLVRTDQGGWLVYDVHLENAGNPATRCQPEGAGTRR